MALHGVIAPRDLDGALHRLGAGIAEEHLVGEARFAQPRGEPLAVRALEQVRHVPELGGLLLQRGDQMRMRVTERVDRDAAGEVEITLAVSAEQPRAFAALERDIGAGEDRQEVRRCCSRGHGHPIKSGCGLRRLHRQMPERGRNSGPGNEMCRLSRRHMRLF